MKSDIRNKRNAGIYLAVSGWHRLRAPPDFIPSMKYSGFGCEGYRAGLLPAAKRAAFFLINSATRRRFAVT
jgi:hypothetical protein